MSSYAPLPAYIVYHAVEHILATIRSEGDKAGSKSWPMKPRLERLSRLADASLIAYGKDAAKVFVSAEAFDDFHETYVEMRALLLAEEQMFRLE